jgi:hypothetical protein
VEELATIVDEDHLNHPTTSQTEGNVQQDIALIQETRQITATDTAEMTLFVDLHISTSMMTFLQSGYRQFTDEHK